MNTRPELFTYAPITRDNFEANKSLVAKALHLGEKTLDSNSSTEKMSLYLHTSLDESFTRNIDNLDKQITERIVATINDDKRVTDYIENQRNLLQNKLKAYYEKLLSLKTALLQEHQTIIEKTQQILFDQDECFAGNYEIQLDIIKKNIGLQLQKAAQYYYANNIVALQKNHANFNRLFSGISSINKNGELKHLSSCPTDFSAYSLQDIQEHITDQLNLCQSKKEKSILMAIKSHLLALNQTANQILAIDDTKFHFTHDIRELEDKANQAKNKAKAMILFLHESEDKILDDFSFNAQSKLDKNELLKAITDAENNIKAFRASAANEQRSGEAGAAPAPLVQAKPIAVHEAPKEVVASTPALVPAKTPAPLAPTWWQKQSRLKKGLLITGIILGVLAIAAGVTAAVFFTGGGAAVVGVGLGVTVAAATSSVALSYTSIAMLCTAMALGLGGVCAVLICSFCGRKKPPAAYVEPRKHSTANLTESMQGASPRTTRPATAANIAPAAKTTQGNTSASPVARSEAPTIYGDVAPDLYLLNMRLI